MNPHFYSRLETKGHASFVCVCLGVIFLAAFFAASTPITFSIITVFLFAGPHNWFEARYMLSRLPARWNSFGSYYIFGIIGVIALTGAIGVLPHVTSLFNFDFNAWIIYIASWNAALVAWIATLVAMRQRQRPYRQWPWMIPIALGLLGCGFAFPMYCFLGMVYAHPLLALWFLDRELARRRPAWSGSYRSCLAFVPLVLVILFMLLGQRPHLEGNDLVSAITRHAGGTILTNVSNHFLVASHTFLELLHYGVWIIALPSLVELTPWNIDQAPLARRNATWKTGLIATTAAGGILVLVLWVAFVLDYATTRNIYFTIAMLHVLAEIPFLLRLL